MAFLTALMMLSITTRLQSPPPVTKPPASFFQIVRESDRDAARDFYKKYINVQGMPVVAAAAVSDAALQRTHSIVTHLLAQDRRIADHAAVFWMKDGAGALVEHGPADRVFSAPADPDAALYLSGARG